MISIVIPTMQKCVDILEKLVKTLNDDNSIGEIIVIDNSTKGLNFSYEKMRVITPESNIFVNPAWNLGTKEAKYDIVGLLNDDIIISPKSCEKVLEKLNENKNIGAIAFHLDDIIPIETIQEAPEEGDFELSKADFVAGGYGMALFFRKELYKPIPETMQIWFGDNYIFKIIEKAGYDNIWIRGQKVYHLGSLTSAAFKKSSLYKSDKKAWNKIKYRWYHYIFSIEEFSDCIKAKIFGLTLRIYSKKNEDKILKL